MQYKVFLDTNDVFTDKGPLEEPFNLRVQELRKFLDDHEVTNVDICLSEIVIRERVQHRLDNIKTAVSQANENIRALNRLGHKSKEISPLKSYRRKLEKRVKEYLKENKIVEVPVPSISKEELLERAILKMKPFNDNGAGFKDTLIYLSIVEDALGVGAADTYIFCTNDGKEFTEEIILEFNSVTKKKLHILKSVTLVSSKLDELLPLNLHLEERNNRIRNIVGENTGKLTESINRHTLPAVPAAYGYGSRKPFTAADIDSYFVATSALDHSWGVPKFSSRADSARSEVAGYNYSSMEFLNFTESGDGKYLVSVLLEASVVYQDRNEYEPSILNRTSYSVADYYRPITKKFNLEVLCDLENRIVETVVVSNGIY